MNRVTIVRYKNISNIGQKQVDAADGFLFPWKISNEQGKEKVKQNIVTLLVSTVFQSCAWQLPH